MGYENRHFKQATLKAEQLVGGQLFPKASIFINAWQKGEVDRHELKYLFNKNEITSTPEESLEQMEFQTDEFKNTNHDIDRLVIKWLMPFMYEGLAEWSMPYKEQGFYKAWKSLDCYNKEFSLNSSEALPDESVELIESLIKEFSEEEHVKT